MTAIFITATGTDIGKTFIAAGLLRHWQVAGLHPEAFKPVATGFDPATAAISDPGVLLSALGRPVTTAEIDRIAPWRFRAPLSPDMAAARENRAIDFAELLAFSRRAVADARGPLLMEGIGGVMVPLDNSHTVLDWIEALKIPVLLVAGSYLGSLSHTLTSLDALAHRRLVVKALVINETGDSTVQLADTAATLGRFAGSTPIVTLPRIAASSADHSAFARIAALL